MIGQTIIPDSELMEFCNWYADFHGATDIAQSVIETCICGYFNTYTKAAKSLLIRCKKLRLVNVANGIVTIVINNKNTTAHGI